MKKLLFMILSLSLISCSNLPRNSVNLDKKNIVDSTQQIETNIDAFDRARQKWKKHLTGNLEFTSFQMIQQIPLESDKLEKEMQLWVTMNKSETSNLLWDDLNQYRGENKSFRIYESYSRLKEMALLYNTKSSLLYKNPQLAEAILFGLEWMNNNVYNETKEIYGNWYHWRIGAPLLLSDILILMYEELPYDRIEANIQTIQHFREDPTNWTGANRLEIALVGAKIGILSEDEVKIIESRESISEIFEFVLMGDGFYEDGSFIQHEDIAYTGSYGIVLIEVMAKMMYLLHDSPWDIEDLSVLNAYNWYYDSFAPFLYNGLMMDAVRGRAISRDYEQDYMMGRRAILAFLLMAETAPRRIAQDMKSNLKFMVLTTPSFNQRSTEELTISEMNRLNALFRDFTIQPKNHSVGHFQFPKMDRVVHKRRDWAFAISMYSERIRNFETINEENLKGWYTGSGMTNLYTKDLDQFNGYFWPTVDGYRLPGTTSDGYQKESKTSSESWVGGATINDTYGTIGMAVNEPNSYQLKKSWFALDDEVVALGAGISGESDRHIITTIENRLLNRKGNNSFKVNGVSLPNELNWAEKVPAVHWAHLEGNTNLGSDIGYYFPESPTLHVLKDKRLGSWKDINGRAQSPATSFNQNYITMFINHGTQIKNGTYSYVLLPNKSIEQTKAYANEPHIDILANSELIQAVKENNLEITAANFWEAGSVSFIHSAQPAAVILQENENDLIISISDPTQSQEELFIEVKKKNMNLVDADSTISIIKHPTSILLKVDVSDSLGASHEIILK